MIDPELIAYLDRKFAAVDQQFVAVRTEMAQEFSAVRTEMAQEFSAVRTEMAEEFSAVRTEMAQEFSAVRTEMAEEFSAVRTEMTDRIEATRQDVMRQAGVLNEETRAEIRAIAEGLQGLDEKVERLHKEVFEEFKEVRAMIKFSYADLDRRLKSLEDRTVDLDLRLRRLEAVSA